MQISVTGKQLEVGDSLRGHIEQSLVAVVDKYFGNAIEAGVVLSREAHLVRADVAVHIGRGIQVRSHQASADAYAAFDVATEHLSKRLRRYKRRLRAHHGTRHQDGGYATVADQYVLAPDSDEMEVSPSAIAGEHPAADNPAGDNPAGDNPIVIAEQKTNIERLTVSEAVMRMDLADLSAMVFHNAAHGGLNVVYRRADGNIGWIDPGVV